MGYIESIQSIAKTKQIEEKLAKISQGLDTEKAKIESLRVTVTQTGDNTKGVQTNAPNNDSPVNATLPTGAQSSTPPAGTETPTNSQSTTTGNGGTTTLFEQKGGSNAVDRLNNAKPNGTDLSGAAQQENNPGGSAAVDIATNGLGDATLDALIAQAQADGYSNEAIQRMADKYLAEKYNMKGTKTAEQLADQSDVTPQPQTATNPFPGQQPGYERLKAVLGFEKDGTVSAATGKPLVVKAQLSGRFPTPSAADTATVGQADWEDADSPPIAADNIIIGASRWVWTTSTSGTFSGYEQAYQAEIDAEPLAAAFHSWYTVTPLIACAAEVTSGGEATNAQPAVQFYVTRVGGGPNFLLSITATNCNRAAGTSGAIATCCSTLPSRENAWPATGAVVLLLEAGKWVANQFDSEIPVSYFYDSSSLRLRVGNGVDIIDDRYLDLDIGVNGGFIASVIDADGSTLLDAVYYSPEGIPLVTGLTSANINQYKPR